MTIASKLYQHKPERQRCRQKTLVVARQFDRRPARPQKIHGCKMERIERSHGHGQRLQRSGEDVGRKRQNSHPADQGVSVGFTLLIDSADMHTVEDLVMQKAAGNERL
jgi:hypothetical protein